jgi:hypothetical protein
MSEGADMERLERASVLLALVEALRSRGNQAGPTHLQKSVYCLQELLGVPLGLRFILYKHGPFSFDLRRDVGGMFADSILTWELQPYPYGPSLKPGPLSGLLKRQFPAPAKRFADQIAFVAEKLAPKRVVELERLGTALYVTLQGKVEGEQRAARICELNPHISPAEAAAALAEVDTIREQAERFRRATDVEGRPSG